MGVCCRWDMRGGGVVSGGCGFAREILRRHFAVLRELGVAAPVWAATTQWSVGPEPEADEAARPGVHPDSLWPRAGSVLAAGDSERHSAEPGDPVVDEFFDDSNSRPRFELRYEVKRRPRLILLPAEEGIEILDFRIVDGD